MMRRSRCGAASRLVAPLVVMACARPLAAQFPRIVPPPPCVISAEDELRPRARPANDRRPLFIVEDLDATLTERNALYAPWALAERLRERLRRDPSLAVSTDGSVQRALYEAGGSADSAAALLGAGWIVRGSSRSAPAGTELTIMLLKRGSAAPAWKDTFRVPAQPLAAIEGAVARGIMLAVKGAAAPVAPRAAGAPRRNDTDEQLARAEYLVGIPTLAAADSARALLERALALEPTSSLVAVQLARAYLLVLERGGVAPPVSVANALRRADELAAFALRQDDRRADAWTLRALVARARDSLAFSGALEAHAKAIALAPRDAEALHARGETYLALGDTERAVADFRGALALEPERAVTLAELARIAQRAGRFHEACAYSNAAIAAEPFTPPAYASRALARLKLGQARDAYADSETASRLSSEPWTVGLQLLIERGVGNAERTAQLTRAITQRYLAPGTRLTVRDAVMLANAFVAVGDRRRAVETLSRATPRGRVLASALRDEAFAPLRGDSAFRALSTVRGARPRPSR